ncbi:MAG TPA: Tim44-like domain-containing protein, partial [Pararobbsia sp.]|nr:Tim44-like domain-containing protein [Pararobbsia sp.]
LQAAWDKGDQGDIYEFTTPEMFAEVKMDLEARGRQANRTDVVELDAQLLGVEEHGSEQLASVRFHGLIRESEGEAAQAFEEVWNFVRDNRSDGTWRLAGIQQVA